MDNIKHALVLTGDVMPGFDAATVWPALATYFRMEPERLRSELLARAPISIKESDDLAKLQNLQSGAAAVGAVTELHVLGGEGSVFALVDNTPRGPIPLAYVEDRVRSGAWPTTVNVAAVGSSAWRPFIAPAASAAAPRPAAPPADQQATVAFSAMASQPAASASGGGFAVASAPVASWPAPAAGDLLPEGPIVHGGFWRRFAANTLDSIILGLAITVLSLIMIGGAAATGSLGLVLTVTFLFYILAIVGFWLYFAKLESGSGQATIGKRVMDLKVTDDRGQRIGFGRATGRFFGKIISGMILNIGYMMAGWTGRKQGLHDMMAGTCVVFSSVSPGQPLPTVRPKMPWYGWVLNVLPFLGVIAYIVFMVTIAASMMSGARGAFSDEALQGGAMQFPDMSQDADAEKSVVQTGLMGIFGEIEMTKFEVEQNVATNNECLSEERTSESAWIETLQLGGYAPECTITVRLSSSTDIPFAARIERIEWTRTQGGDWDCTSSMDSSYLPWPCQ